MKIKRAFTFAELMISLVIIAVITAILYPTISELAPNNNKHLFKAAYKTTELIISEITANPNNINGIPQEAQALCNEFKDRLNVVSYIASGGTSTNGCSSASDAEIRTSNGMRWKFIKGTGADSGKMIIYIDVNAANNKTPSSSGATSSWWSSGSFTINDTTVRDTFKITVNPAGKITVDDSIGQAHLQDNTDN